MLEAIVGTLGLAVIGVFGWAFQLNTKVSVQAAALAAFAILQDQRHEDLLRLVDTKFDVIIQKIVGLTDLSNERTISYSRRLERIERALNGALHKD